MNKPDIIKMLNLHLIQLTDTANAKNAEMQQQLAGKIAETTQFLAKLAEAEIGLKAQLAESEQWLKQLQQPLNFETELNEIAISDETNIANVQHQLAEKVHQQITEIKAETIANVQALSDRMAETQQQLSGKSRPWTDWQRQFDAHFGKQIQWLKLKIADQLVFCADKLKA